MAQSGGQCPPYADAGFRDSALTKVGRHRLRESGFQ